MFPRQIHVLLFPQLPVQLDEKIGLLAFFYIGEGMALGVRMTYE